MDIPPLPLPIIPWAIRGGLTLLPCRKVPDLRNLAQAMLAANATWPVDSTKPPTGVQKANVRDTWEFALGKVSLQGGPYDGRTKSEK